MPAQTSPLPATEPTASARETALSVRSIVQVETNLLRFPFFCLHTKGLRDVDFKEVRGTRVENGETHEFVFRVSRNTGHLYPGPLSRKAHFALLSLLRKQGFPFRNPIAFTWRQLAREMQVAYSGPTRLKDALYSTLGTMIKSTYALKHGTSRETLPARERGYSLYAECLFTNEPKSDGTVADRNYVTLADWYLANLNALCAVPIDYALWNRLNDQSPLSSRLYEFLLFSFSAGIDTFTINYPKLCQFLPATVEIYASKAKEQLGPALRLLAEEGLIGSVEWGTGRNGEPQLQIARGVRLTVSAAPAVAAFAQADVFETVTTHEGRNPLSPTERLVREFHIAWSGGEGRAASPGELDAAKECVDLYGFDVATHLLPKVVKRMRQEFPDAKTFGATRDYFAEIHAEHLKRDSAFEKAKLANLEEHLDEDEQQRRTMRHEQLEAVWKELPANEREAIENAVVAANPRLRLSKLPAMLHRMCLDELDKRKGSSVETV
jgi:hypothetical protein